MKFKIITVSGAHSGVGKTMITERLLKALRGWSALKVTVVHKGPCPTGRDCGACGELKPEFVIVGDKAILNREGKDTQRLKKAGAREVLWLKARPKGLREGLKKAISKFRSTKGIIVEGTSVLKYLRPELAILVKKKGSVLKPAAKEALSKVDLIMTL